MNRTAFAALLTTSLTGTVLSGSVAHAQVQAQSIQVQGVQVQGSQVQGSQVQGGRPQDVVIDYYNALGRGQYRAAYQLWTRSGLGSGQTYGQFKRGFAATRATYVQITGATRTEGAAGSLYATVPVTVTAQLRNGQRQVFTGDYILRKNNTRTGDPRTWNWHIDRATLRAR